MNIVHRIGVFTILILFCSDGFAMHLRYIASCLPAVKKSPSASKALMHSVKRELWIVNQVNKQKNISVAMDLQTQILKPVVIETVYDIDPAHIRVEQEKEKLRNEMSAVSAQIDHLTQNQGFLCMRYALLCRQCAEVQEIKNREQKKHESAAAWFLGLEE